MEIITITKERMEALLPKNIATSIILSDDAKKVLAALVNYQFTNPIAKEVGFVAISNPNLAQSASIQAKKMLGAVQELIDHELIIRKVGRTRTQGEKAMASEYYVQFQNFRKKIKKLTFEDLFSNYIKSSGTPSGTANTNTSTVSISITDSESESKSDSESKSYTESKSNTKSKTESYTESETDTSELPF